MPKGRILVVDDDRLVLAIVTHGLTQAGYEVVEADNGDDAILAARQQRPDLALLDIRMEGKSGLDVAEYLRDVGRVPYIFLSACGDEDTLAQVRALGAGAHLAKPVDLPRIVAEVDTAMEQLRAAAPRGPAETTALADPLPLAVGVLMHRHSMSRTQALERLGRMAADRALPVRAQAERLVQAVEELARSAPPAQDETQRPSVK